MSSIKQLLPRNRLLPCKGTTFNREGKHRATGTRQKNTPNRFTSSKQDW